MHPRWLLLLTHIPAAPAYLRVKVRRRLQQLGAVPVKQGVFALPCGDASVEDFQWLRAEIEAGGGEASICEAGFVAGLTDDDVEELFRSARDVDYRDLLREAQTLREELARGGGRTEGPAGEVMAAAARLREKLEEIRAIDFFTAGGRSDVEAALNEIELSVPAAGERDSRWRYERGTDHERADIELSGANLGDPPRGVRRPHGERLAHSSADRPRRQIPIRCRP